MARRSMIARRNPFEVFVGVIVIALTLVLLLYLVASLSSAGASRYMLQAEFARIDGIAAGSDVRIAGVKVGTVVGTSINPKTYKAVVRLAVRPDIRLPADSLAEITSENLLGGDYISLVPGQAGAKISSGGEVAGTQSSIDLESLLGKFILSVTDLVSIVQKRETGH
jgi:phospholipid/cholesterol/gamma-HCH transport system substrate-binding protein